MRKTQAIRFWTALQETTEVEEALSRFVNRKGYGSKRTLERYVQADKGFAIGSPIEELRTGTGWSLAYLGKLQTWWVQWQGGRRQQPPTGLTDLVADAGTIQRHRETLLAPLLDLKGVGPFPFHDYDLAIWRSRADDPCWPVAKGRVCRDSSGLLTVWLDVESRLEWSYLRQHLPNDPVWTAVRNWQEAMAADVKGRLALFQAVKDGIRRPAADGGLGLPICAEIGLGGTGQPAVSFYYAFRLFDQVVSHALKLRHAPYASGAFTLDSPDTLHLGGYAVVSSPDPAQRQAAVDFLLTNQSGWESMPQSQAAAEAFRRAEAATGTVNQHLERLRLALAFPSGSVCDGCRGWAVR